MKLPDARHVVIDRAKIVDYLLDGAHPDNGGKARFFSGWGFSVANWQVLARAIRDMVHRNEVVGHL